MQSPVQIIKTNKTPLLIAFALVLLAKAPAFLSPIYSVDAWIAGSAADDHQFFRELDLALSQYRFGLVLLFAFFRLFEYDAVPVAFSSVFLACGFSASASLLAYLTIDPSGRRTPYLIFATIFCLHPFTTEIFTFVDVTLFVSFSIALGLYGALLVNRGEAPRQWIGGAALIVAALSIYQIAIHYILITLLLAGVAALMRDEDWRPAVRSIVIALLSAAVCLLIAKGVNAALQIQSDGRGSLIGLSEISSRLPALQDALTRVFSPPPRLVPPVVTAISVIALSLAVLATLRAIYLRRGAVAVFLAVLVIAAAAFCITALPIIGKTLWLVPRVLSAVAVFLGGILALGWLASGRVARASLVGATGLLVLGYVASSNRILFDQWRVNRWDAQQANRILARLEAFPEFPQVKRLAIQGGFYTYPAGLPTAFADLNMSSLAPGLSKNYTIRQTTGYNFPGPAPDETNRAEDYCRNALKWPAAQSVTITGELGVVCLGQ